MYSLVRPVLVLCTLSAIANGFGGITVGGVRFSRKPLSTSEIHEVARDIDSSSSRQISSSRCSVRRRRQKRRGIWSGSNAQFLGESEAICDPLMSNGNLREDISPLTTRLNEYGIVSLGALSFTPSVTNAVGDNSADIFDPSTSMSMNECVYKSFFFILHHLLILK